MGDDLATIKVNVNGYLTSQRSGASAADIEDFYKLMLGIDLPYRKFNCRNAEEFIVRHMSDVVRVENVHGAKIFKPILMKESMHIADLVNRTKDTKKAKASRAVRHNYKIQHPSTHSKKHSKYQHLKNIEFSKTSSLYSHAKHGSTQSFKSKGFKSNYQNDDIPSFGGKMGDAKHCVPMQSSHPAVKPLVPLRFMAMGAGESQYQSRFPAMPKYFLQERASAVLGKEDICEKKMFNNIAPVAEANRERRYSNAESLERNFSFSYDSTSPMKEFENLTISLKSRDNGTERLVSFSKGPGRQNKQNVNESFDNKPFHPLSPLTEDKDPLGSIDSNVIKLQDQTKCSRLFDVAKGDNVVSQVFGKVSNPEILFSSPAANTMHHLMAVPNRLYSPMMSPNTDQLFTQINAPLFSTALNTPVGPLQSKHGEIAELEGKILQGGPHNRFSVPMATKPTSPLSSPMSAFIKQLLPSPTQTVLVGEDPSIIPPTTSPSFSPSIRLSSPLYIARTNVMKGSTSSISALNVATSPTTKTVQMPLTNGISSAIQPNSGRSSLPDPSQCHSGSDHDSQDMVQVTDVENTSLVHGQYLSSGSIVSFALTNLEDIGEVDLDYVRILLLNRHFKANFDCMPVHPQNSVPDAFTNKFYGTLYKKNGPAWINMNLFILEETLDPQFVKKSNLNRPTYTVSELFSIRRKVGCHTCPDLVNKVGVEEIFSPPRKTNSAKLDMKLAFIHSFADNGMICLDFLSLDEDVSQSATREKVNGRTRVNCYLKGYSKDEVEWIPSKILKMKDALKIGSKVIVKIFERSYQSDPNIFIVDLRTFQQRFFMTDIFRREPSLCPYFKLDEVGHPPKGERIIVTHVRSPKHLNALPLKHLESFGDMFAAMQEYYNREQWDDIYLDIEPTERRLCAFKSSSDGLWYRGRVETVNFDSEAVVYSVDIGNYESLTENSMRELPNNFRSLPLLSYFLKLSGAVDPNETKVALEARVLHKVFRFFPSDPKHLSSGVLLNIQENTPIIM